MTAYYWNKLPHAYFDDRQIDTLDGELYKVYIKLTLLAGMTNDYPYSGELPDFEDIVFKMRWWQAEELETMMLELVSRGLLSMVNGRWIISDFATTQAPDSAKKRKQEQRKREAARLNKEYLDVTNRDTEESREDEKRGDEKRGEDKTPTTSPLSLNELDNMSLIWIEKFMRDFYTLQGIDAERERVVDAVKRTMLHIRDKDYDKRYNYDWIEERYNRKPRKIESQDNGIPVGIVYGGS